MKTEVMMAAIVAALFPIVARSASRAACHSAPVRAATPAGERAMSIADVKVTTQDGRIVDFYSDLVKDKVVAVNFVFTSCTTVCPPMGAIFGQLQKLNAEHVGKDLHLISVSIDPVVDSPQRLEAWRARFGKPEGWTLVTGDEREITRLLKSMNVYVPNFQNHQPVTLIGNDASGSWRRSYGFTTAARLTSWIEEIR